MQPMGLFRKMRGPAGKKGQKLSDEIYSVFVAVVNSVRVEHAYLGKNVRALVVLTFSRDLKQERRRPQRNVGKK